MTERLEDLRARSKEVLIRVKPEVREKLIRFARTSRDPKTGKPSPTKAEKRALQSTRDADKALACWQLTVILRDFGEEEFEKHVSDICQKSHQETVSQNEQKPKKEERMAPEKEEKESFGRMMTRIINELWDISKKINGEWPPSRGFHINLIQTGYIRGETPFIVEICVPVLMNHKLRDKADSLPELEELLNVPDSSGYGSGKIFGFVGRASKDRPEKALPEAFRQLLGKIEMVKSVRGIPFPVPIETLLGSPPPDK